MKYLKINMWHLGRVLLFTVRKKKIDKVKKPCPWWEMRSNFLKSAFAKSYPHHKKSPICLKNGSYTPSYPHYPHFSDKIRLCRSRIEKEQPFCRK